MSASSRLSATGLQPLKTLLRPLRARYHHARCTSWRLDGIERESRERLVLFYAGQRENMSYLAHLAFRSFEVIATRSLWRTQALRAALSPTGGHALAVVDSEAPIDLAALAGRPAFAVPAWVYGELDLGQATRRMRTSRNIKRDLERIRAERLGWRITRDPAALHGFFREMYLPYAERRHGAARVVVSAETFRRAIPGAELLLVEREGRPIAGGVVVFEGGQPIAWIAGVKDGNPDYVRAGALAALYCFQVQDLAQRGYRTLQIGSTRAFLNDGVMQFKRKWGMRIVRASAQRLTLVPLSITRALRSFLVRHPFIVAKEERLEAAVFFEGTGAEDLEAAEQAMAYATPGVQGISLYDPRRLMAGNALVRRLTVVPS